MKTTIEKIANGMLIAAEILLCLTLAYLIYIANIHYFSSSLILFMVLVFIGMACIGWALNWEPENKIRLTLVMTFSGATVYLVEFYLSNIHPPLQIIAHEYLQGEHSNRRSQAEIADSLQKVNSDAIPLIGLSNNVLQNVVNPEIFPPGGVARKTTLMGQEGGNFIFYFSDEHGFRNPIGQYDKAIDIALIGDSFTQGCYVDEGDDISGVLHHAGHEVINLGFAGNGPLLEYVSFNEYATSIKPSLTVWLFYENDMCDLSYESKSPLLKAYLKKDIKWDLMNRQAEIDNLLFDYDTKLKETREKNVDAIPDTWYEKPFMLFLKLSQLRNRLHMNAFTPFKKYEYLNPLFKEILSRTKIKSQHWGGDLLFVYLPSWLSLYKGLGAGDYNRQILDVPKSLGIPIIDMHAIFTAHPDPLSLFPFRRHGHYTEEGYQLVAEAIDIQIKNNE